MDDYRTGLPLPHTYPFLLIDRIVESVPAQRAVAVKNLTRGDPLLDADGLLPSVLLVEAMAQCAGVAVLGGDRGRTAVLASINRFRTRSRVVAGDQLRVSANVLRSFGAMAKVRAVVRVDGRPRAACDVVLQIVL
jgi:3-hydroxyacyl-[acyl-carrier-protein] dehydratase